MLKASLVQISLVVMISSCLGVAQANEFAISAGTRFDNADSNTAGTSIEARMNFQAGALGFFELGGPSYIRGAFNFVTRSYGVKSSGVSTGDGKFTYFDVPIGYLYRFSDYGGAFVGPVFAFNFSKDCPGGTCTEASSMPMGLQFGASFKIAPQIGGEVYFETLTTKLAKGFENPKAVVAQIYFSFD